MFRKISGIEKFYVKEGGGGREYHDFLSKFFCLTVPKNFVGEHFSVSIISCIERFYASEIYVRDFVSKLFCLTVPKHFVEEPFCVSESFRYQKRLWIRGDNHDFLSEMCCLTVPKKIRENKDKYLKFNDSENF